MTNAIELVISSKDQSSAGFKSATKNAKEMGEGFNKAGDAADGAEGKAQGFSDTLTGTKDVMGGVGEIAKGNLFEGFVQAGQGAADLAGGLAEFLIPLAKVGVSMVKNAASTVASTAANLAASAASKTMAAAQWVLNAAMTANPIGLVVVAIGLLVAAFVIAWKKSETFREIMTTAFSAIGLAVLAMAEVGLKGFRFLVGAALDAASALLNIAAKIPGPQQAAMKQAAEAFNGFKASVANTFDAAGRKLDQWGNDLRKMPKVAKLNGDINDLTSKLNTAKARLNDKSLTKTQTAAVKADIRQLEQKIASAKAQLASVKGKTVAVTIRYSSTGVNLTTPSRVGGTHTGGTIRGFAGGGNPPPGMSWVGETGPELLELSGGTARVTPAGNSQRMAKQSGGWGTVVLKIESSGSAMSDLLVEVLRKAVKIEGGDVQVVLGA